MCRVDILHIVPVQADNSAADDHQASSETTKSDPDDECSYICSSQTRYIALILLLHVIMQRTIAISCMSNEK